MELLFLILVLFLSILIGLIYWIYRIYKMFRQKQFRKARLHVLILLIILLVSSWELRIMPLSVTHDFYQQTPALTGRKFWSWNDFRYQEWGIRGEGFTFEVYHLSPEIASYFKNPDPEFFELYPSDKFKTSKWKRTPLSAEDEKLLEIFTPVYGQWSNRLTKKIIRQQEIIKSLARTKGSYYAVKTERGNDFFLISPDKMIMVYINHNM